MTRTELNRFRTILKVKYAELARATGRRDGITIERTPDTLDEIRFAADREMSTRNLEWQSGVLRSVQVALDRIVEGSYGTCLQCDEEISHKRLDAMPWATLCIQCQESADGSSRRSFASEGSSLRKAA
jgi:DnaK suppressor protein